VPFVEFVVRCTVGARRRAELTLVFSGCGVVEAPGVSRCLGVVSSRLHRSGCCVVHTVGLQACSRAGM